MHRITVPINKSPLKALELYPAERSVSITLSSSYRGDSLLNQGSVIWAETAAGQINSALLDSSRATNSARGNFMERHRTMENAGQANSSCRRTLTSSLDWRNDHILVFFFITVLVVNSESLRVNSSPFALGAQSRADCLNWFSALKRDTFVPQRLIKWAQKVEE